MNMLHVVGALTGHGRLPARKIMPKRPVEKTQIIGITDRHAA
jgi:hypothetical protein